MSEMQDKKEAPATHRETTEREMPLDTKLLSEAVIELNISRKNVGIYPPGHIQITNSIDRAFAILQQLFDIRSEMTLGIAKDTLLIGQDYLDRKNPVYRDFALSLNQQGIAAVTFVKGLNREELERFHRIITTKPEDIRDAGGIGSVLSNADIPHVRVQVIDYSSFHMTEEQEISRPRVSKGEQAGSSKWQDFVSQLAAGKLASLGQGVALKDSDQMDPSELARLLNERKLDTQAAVQSYDSIITNYVRGVAEQKQPTEEQSATLANLNDLLRELHPELRKQFLSVTFKNVTSPGASAKTEDILGGFPDDMVIEMLRHASQEGRQISPTLAGLMQKLSRVEAGDSGHRDQASYDTQQERPAPVISPEHMNTLFDRETYEQYVTEDYDATLKQMTESASGMAGVPAEGFPLDDYTATLEDEHVDFQIGRAILAFLEEDIEEEDYREFSRKLVSVVPDLLSSGNFALLLDALETFRRHSGEKAPQEARSLAGEALTAFQDPAFLEGAVAAFDSWARTKGREAAGFLLALGPGTIPALMDLYAVDESPGGRRILFDLLANFGQASVDEAVKRLRDPRSYYVRNLIMLIRWAGNKAVLSHLKPLLRHADEKVRMEAIAALLRFKDREGIALLREFLHAKDPDVVSQAVFLAGQYRVADVVPDLTSLIKKVILFDADYTVNEELIKALGEIGDARAIPDITKLARASWTFYPESLARMKGVLFESLARYPRSSIQGLLTIGEKATDDRIRRACKKIAERK